MRHFPFGFKTNEITMVDESMHCNWSKFHTRSSTCVFGTSLGAEESAMDITSISAFCFACEEIFGEFDND